MRADARRRTLGGSAANSAAAASSGPGWYCPGGAGGVATVYFDRPFKRAPAVTVSIAGATATHTTTVHAVQPWGFTFGTYSGGVGVGAGIHFTAEGEA